MDTWNSIDKPNAQVKKGPPIIGSASGVSSLINREIPQRLIDGNALNRETKILSKKKFPNWFNQHLYKITLNLFLFILQSIES